MWTMHFVCTAPVLKVFVCHSQSVLERHLTDAAKKGKFRQQKPRYTAVNPDITDIYTWYLMIIIKNWNIYIYIYIWYLIKPMISTFLLLILKSWKQCTSTSYLGKAKIDVVHGAVSYHGIVKMRKKNQRTSANRFTHVAKCLQVHVHQWV